MLKWNNELYVPLSIFVFQFFFQSITRLVCLFLSVCACACECVFERYVTYCSSPLWHGSTACLFTSLKDELGLVRRDAVTWHSSMSFSIMVKCSFHLLLLLLWSVCVWEGGLFSIDQKPKGNLMKSDSCDMRHVAYIGYRTAALIRR